MIRADFGGAAARRTATPSARTVTARQASQTGGSRRWSLLATGAASARARGRRPSWNRPRSTVAATCGATTSAGRGAERDVGRGLAVVGPTTGREWRARCEEATVCRTVRRLTAGGRADGTMWLARAGAERARTAALLLGGRCVDRAAGIGRAGADSAGRCAGAATTACRGAAAGSSAGLSTSAGGASSADGSAPADDSATGSARGATAATAAAAAGGEGSGAGGGSARAGSRPSGST